MFWYFSCQSLNEYCFLFLFLFVFVSNGKFFFFLNLKFFVCTTNIDGVTVIDDVVITFVWIDYEKSKKKLFLLCLFTLWQRKKFICIYFHCLHSLVIVLLFPCIRGIFVARLYENLLFSWRSRMGKWRHIFLYIE